MTDLLESMRQTFLDPVTRHAILVHTPIVIGLLAIPFVAVLPCLGKRPAIAYRLLTATILFLAAVVAWQATEAGEEAVPIVESRIQGEDAKQTLQRHTELGERIPLLMAGTAILTGLTVMRPRPAKIAIGSLATLLALVTGLAISITAHEGGLLVYRHGAAGTPAGPRTWIEPTTSDSSAHRPQEIGTGI